MALGLFLAGATLWAHHSPSAEFDMTKKVTVSGTLTKIEWVNPHIFVYIDVKGESWRMESNPPSWFRRVGIGRSDLAKGVGQTVTAEGNRAKDGSAFAYMSKITFMDGTSLELVNKLEEEGSK